MNTTNVLTDFNSFYVFRNVIQSKLNEARTNPVSLKRFILNPEVYPFRRNAELEYVYEEQSDFIAQVYKQCQFWADLYTNTAKSEEIKKLEDSTRELENTSYHSLFLLERLKKQKQGTCDVVISGCLSDENPGSLSFMLNQ